MLKEKIRNAVSERVYFQVNAMNNRTLVKRVYQKLFHYFSTKTYVVGTQKNRLNEKIFTILRCKFLFI